MNTDYLRHWDQLDAVVTPQSDLSNMRTSANQNHILTPSWMNFDYELSGTDTATAQFTALWQCMPVACEGYNQCLPVQKLESVITLRQQQLAVRSRIRQAANQNQALSM